MIQCEQCLVWQHYDCIGIKEEPDNYYCEECQPENHPFWLKLDESVELPTKPKFKSYNSTELRERIAAMELYFLLHGLNTKWNPKEWELYDDELKGSNLEVESMLYSAIQRFKSRIN